VPEWPTYNAATSWTMELGKNSKLHQHYRKPQYDAHDLEHARVQSGERDGRAVVEALRQARRAGEGR
jgi:hypothetical protein